MGETIAEFMQRYYVSDYGKEGGDAAFNKMLNCMKGIRSYYRILDSADDGLEVYRDGSIRYMTLDETVTFKHWDEFQETMEHYYGDRGYDLDALDVPELDGPEVFFYWLHILRGQDGKE